MNDRRAFWISGLATLAVVVLMGSALWARSKPAEPNFTTMEGMSAPTTLAESGPSTDQDALRAELEVAYADLDTAYREIEGLRAQNIGGGHDDDDDEREGRRGHHDRHEREERE